MPLSADDLAFRRRRVTASVLPQLVPGAYPESVKAFREKDALDAFVRITGRHRDRVDDERDRRSAAGHRVERFALEWGAERLALEWAYFGPVAHPDAPWFSATADAVAIERLRGGVISRIVLEAKAVGLHLAHFWGDEDQGAEGVPPYVHVQQEAQAEVCDADECVTLAYFGGTDFRVYRWERDPAFGRVLLDIATRFFREHVDPDRPPAPGPWTSLETIAALYPEARRPLERANDDEELLVEEYIATRALEAEVRARRDELAAALAARIADRDGVAGDGWRARFRVRAAYRVEAFDVASARILDVRSKSQKSAPRARKDRA